MPSGRIEPRQVAILKGIGDWLKTAGESVYDLRGGPYKPGGWGAATCRGSTIYLHLLSWSDVPESFPALGATIRSADLLTGGKVAVHQSADGVRFEVAPEDRQPVDTIIRLTIDGDATALKPLLVPTRSIARFCQVRASGNQAAAHLIVDDDPQTEWVADTKPCWIEVDLGADRPFDRIDLREEGHEWEVRTTDFDLAYRTASGDWVALDHGNRIGHTYRKTFPQVTGRYIRLTINSAGNMPHFSEFQVYRTP